jgi:septum site-determining protein MinD
MSGKVITVTSGKGGVGKTTATANIGASLAALGNKVVCIDADIGLRNLDVVMGLENRIVYDLVDVVEGRCKLRQAMIRDKRLEDLYLIPAAQTRDKSALSPNDMKRISDELRKDYDYILIDSPAGIERGFQNAIAPANEVVIVTNPEVSSVRDADRIIGMVEAEQKGPAKLVINRINMEMVQRGDMLAASDVLELLAVELIGIVPEDQAVLVSTNRGSPIALDKKSKTGQAFRNIAARLTGEQVPFAAANGDNGFLGRLSKLIRAGSK